ncbi:MAG: EAL domain-containing protein, partial [Spirochaetaceae bacterium]
VETKQQFDFLKRSSCDFVQGFYFSKPLSAVNAQPHFEKETLFFNGCV